MFFSNAEYFTYIGFSFVMKVLIKGFFKWRRYPQVRAFKVNWNIKYLSFFQIFYILQDSTPVLKCLQLPDENYLDKSYSREGYRKSS
jgi:hypothetical protein